LLRTENFFYLKLTKRKKELFKNIQQEIDISGLQVCKPTTEEY